MWIVIQIFGTSNKNLSLEMSEFLSRASLIYSKMKYFHVAPCLPSSILSMFKKIKYLLSNIIWWVVQLERN